MTGAVKMMRDRPTATVLTTALLRPTRDKAVVTPQPCSAK